MNIDVHMKFIDSLLSSIASNGPVCVGLDSRYDRLPTGLKTSSIADSIFQFNKEIVNATHDLASAYKMNVAFYAGFGTDGLEGLRRTNEFIKNRFPEIPLLADCKRSEMGESVKMVKQEIFDWLQFDCVMVTPWFGFDTIKDYLDNSQNGVCVYVHDSNPTASEFQDLELKNEQKVYEYVAQRIVNHWNTNGNVWMEAGATYPKELTRIRQIAGEDMPILTAGVGIQGGSIDVLKGLFGNNNQRLLVNSSRGIIFAGEGKKDYFAEVRNAAKQLKNSLLALTE